MSGNLLIRPIRFKLWNKVKPDINFQAADIRSSIAAGLKDSGMTEKQIDKESKQAGKDYRKQAMSEARKDFDYKKLTGHNRNLTKSNGEVGWIKGDNLMK